MSSPEAQRQARDERARIRSLPVAARGCIHTKREIQSKEGTSRRSEQARRQRRDEAGRFCSAPEMGPAASHHRRKDMPSSDRQLAIVPIPLRYSVISKNCSTVMKEKMGSKVNDAHFSRGWKKLSIDPTKQPRTAKAGVIVKDQVKHGKEKQTTQPRKGKAAFTMKDQVNKGKEICSGSGFIAKTNSSYLTAKNMSCLSNDHGYGKLPSVPNDKDYCPVQEDYSTRGVKRNKIVIELSQQSCMET